MLSCHGRGARSRSVSEWMLASWSSWDVATILWVFYLTIGISWRLSRWSEPAQENWLSQTHISHCYLFGWINWAHFWYHDYPNFKWIFHKFMVNDPIKYMGLFSISLTLSSDSSLVLSLTLIKYILEMCILKYFAHRPTFILFFFFFFLTNGRSLPWLYTTHTPLPANFWVLLSNWNDEWPNWLQNNMFDWCWKGKSPSIEYNVCEIFFIQSVCDFFISLTKILDFHTIYRTESLAK